MKPFGNLVTLLLLLAGMIILSPAGFAMSSQSVASPVALSQKLTQSQAILNQAYQSYQQRNAGATARQLETLLTQWPRPPGVLYLLIGQLYETQSDWISARDSYARGLATEPDNLSLPYAAILYRLRQFSQMEQVLAQLLDRPGLLPDLAGQARYMLGSLYAEQGRYQAALPHLRAAAETFPTEAIVRYNLGVVYEGLAASREASEAYRTALANASPELAALIQQHLARLNTPPLPAASSF